MLLRIKVKPNAKTDELTIGQEGELIVKIKAPPVDGKANKYLIGFLAAYFDLPKSSITLLKGLGNQYKAIEVDASEELIRTRLGR